MFKGIQYAIDHYPGAPISQSFGCAEQSFQSAAEVQLAKYEKIYQQAAAARCTVLAAAGDWGTANFSKQGNVYPLQTVIWPASSPSVTAVGGTWLQYGWEWNPAITFSDFLATSDFVSFLNFDSTPGRVEAVWREDWFELQGYPEFEMFSLHIDSVFCYMAHHNGIFEEMLEDPMRIYHIEHGTGSGWTPEGANKLMERIAAKGISCLECQEVLAWATEMRRLNRPLVLNYADWGMANDILPETVVGKTSC